MLVVSMLICTFVVPASAMTGAFSKQETGTTFNSGFTKTGYIYSIDGSTKLGSYKYGLEERAILSDRDFSISICEWDWNHDATIANGIGSSAGTQYHSSGNMAYAGNASVYTSHRGPTVTFGGSITT